jgi:hypothetical protein
MISNAHDCLPAVFDEAISAIGPSTHEAVKTARFAILGPKCSETYDIRNAQEGF